METLYKVFAISRTAGVRSRVKFIFGGCGGRALREPPKIAPLCGAVVRAAACGPRSPTDCISLPPPPANSTPRPLKRKKRQKMHVFCWMLQLFVLLLDQAIRRKRRESRCCCVNVRNLLSAAIRGCPRRVVTAPRLVGVHLNALRHDGRGPLVL